MALPYEADSGLLICWLLLISIADPLGWPQPHPGVQMIPAVYLFCIANPWTSDGQDKDYLRRNLLSTGNMNLVSVSVCHPGCLRWPEFLGSLTGNGLLLPHSPTTGCQSIQPASLPPFHVPTSHFHIQKGLSHALHTHTGQQALFWPLSRCSDLPDPEPALQGLYGRSSWQVESGHLLTLPCTLGSSSAPQSHLRTWYGSLRKCW